MWASIFERESKSPKITVAQAARDRLRRRKLLEQTSANAFSKDDGNPVRNGGDEAIGEFHEQLRLRCQDILTEFRYQQTLFTDVEETFESVNLLSEQLQKTIRNLRETETRKAGLQQSEEKLREKLVELDTDRDRLSERYALLESAFKNLQSDNKSQKESLDTLSANYEKQFSELNLAAKRRDEFQQHLQETTRDLKALQNNFKSTSAQLQKTEIERKQLYENTLLEREEKIKIAEGREQLERELVALKKDYVALGQKEKQAQEKISLLHDAIGKLNVESNDLRASLAEGQAIYHTNKIAYEAKLEGQSGRVRLSEQLLATARENLREMAEIKDSYSSLQKQFEIVSGDLSKMKAETEAAYDKLAEAEKTNKALSARYRALENEVRIKEHDSQQQSAQVDASRNNLTAAKQRYEKDRANLIEQINQLKDQVVKESSGRALAEGALDVARKDRLQLQKAMMDLKQELGSPQSAAAVPVQETARQNFAASN